MTDGRRWMMFVDGENLTFRGQAMALRQGLQLADERFPMPGVFLWMPSNPPVSCPFEAYGHVRAYYYTSLVGDEPKLISVKDRLRNIGFDPQVFKKMTGDEKSKGVDITLTKDMLSHAFLGNYQEAVLVAGDGDYVPLIDEVKRLGKRVTVMFFRSETDGLNPELRRVADLFIPLDEPFAQGWRSLR